MSDTTIPELTDPLAGKDPNELPAWGRESISTANNQAATFRTQLRTKTEEHTSALGQIDALTGEKAQAEAAKSTAELALLKLNVSLAAGIPGDKAVEFAALLQGNDETSLKAHAESVKGLFGTPNHSQKPTDPNQGHGSGDGTAGLSPGGAFIANRLLGGR